VVDPAALAPSLPTSTEQARIAAVSSNIGIIAWADGRTCASCTNAIYAGPQALTGVLGVPPGAPQDGVRLSAARPNPFGVSTRLEFALSHASLVRVDVVDVQGRLVRTLTDAAWAAGDHGLDWDGRTTTGRRTVPGVYLVRLVAGREARRQMIVPLP